MADRLFGSGADDFQQAEWLAEKLQGGWRYDHTASRWHHWDGFRWAPDKTEQARHVVAEQAALHLIGKPELGIPRVETEGERKALTKLLSLPAVDRALSALSTFPGYGTNGDDWDSDPLLLGCTNGIVNLQTNTLIANPTPDMLVTRTTGHDFTPVSGPSEFEDAAPTFMRSMGEWMSDDPTMMAFLLLWFGASLFGFSPEQRFLLMTGIGRNGKGALKHSIIKAVGEYGEQFDANLYMRTKFGGARSDQARADLLKLKGMRIAFFSEPEGNRFNEELLKAHTGGDRIAARALYSNNIQTWDPTHSITFLVNNAPEIEDLGPSMASRVMVADFRERFDGEREDKRLYGKLEEEAPGILSILCWAASAWHARWSSGEGGITLPQRVVEQSRKFMERGDPVANALNDAFVIGDGLSCRGQAAYDAYLEWHAASDPDADELSMVKFSAALERKGFHKVKTETGMVWKGLRPLRADEAAARA